MNNNYQLLLVTDYVEEIVIFESNNTIEIFKMIDKIKKENPQVGKIGRANSRHNIELKIRTKIKLQVGDKTTDEITFTSYNL